MSTPSDLLPRWLVADCERGEQLLSPPAHLQLRPWNDGFTPSGCSNRQGKIVVDQPRTTRSAFRVLDGAVSSTTADMIYASAVRAKVWGAFVRTSELSLYRAKDNVDQLRERVAAQDEQLLSKEDKAQYRQMLARLAVEEFLVTQSRDVIQLEDWQRTHGVAVWVIASDCDDETEYHLDYAEMLRYETNVIFPPFYGATLHVSPLAASSTEISVSVDDTNKPPHYCTGISGDDVGTLEGGGFFVNTRGLDHYQQYGYKTRLHTQDVSNQTQNESSNTDTNTNSSTNKTNKLSTDALEQLTTREPGWQCVPYKYRRGIICDGEFPHFSGRVRSLPTATATTSDSQQQQLPVKRVVVGFNLFPHEIGAFVERFPEHSDAFNKYVKLSQTALKQPHQWSLESVKKNPKQAAFLKFLARKIREKQAQELQSQELLVQLKTKPHQELPSQRGVGAVATAASS